ncbi:MAG: hypothetical protein A3A33_00700 [Candidatus Yanofskybacteria bacterium RIFCSPLOWO2_01_FULL_49_25]|uniref:Uncharacterized protein n=1 Tax=Candidatus Yanofskybacteria bacterium RIFCSPLOWO2_01_FULL_49_25 TaxID=1802701 RepID=A0A1F8GZ99_9BACT|nr:MAG: hypothetical protein A3A33_00700 [Candidatus Yanofskybacteria bacterium RIFCSPLOWO2_01_FULL_49_25]
MEDNIYHLLDVDSKYFLTHLDERDTLYDKIWAAPETIQGLFFNSGTPAKVKSVCDHFKLTDEQSALLSRYIRNVTIANAYIGDMTADLQAQLGVDAQTAQGIANALMTDLLVPAMGGISQLQAEAFKDKIVQNQELMQKAAKTAGVPTKNVINLRDQ